MRGGLCNNGCMGGSGDREMIRDVMAVMAVSSVDKLGFGHVLLYGASAARNVSERKAWVVK